MLELYKDLVIDHGNNPRNKYIISNWTHFARGYNYLCGDKCEVYLFIENDIIKNISFDGTGCIISIASASLMTTNLKLKNLIECNDLFKYFINIVTGKIEISDIYNDLNILSNVKKFPNRVKCATLVWHTYKSIFSKNNVFKF